MKLNQILSFLIIVSSLISMGCTSSLVYSPTINLPVRPMTQKQAQFLGGVGYFPETRPEVTKEKTAFGGEATFRMALCDHYSLQFKGWKDLSENRRDDRFGFSFGTMAIVKNSPNYKLSISPTAALVFGDGSLEGGGAGMPFSFWFTKFNSVNLYASVNPVFGVRAQVREKREWGWGIITNIGTSILVKNHLTINLELSSVKQVNVYEDKRNNFLCPSVNIGYLFHGKK
ncbi:MAG: hypothetical protein V3V99_08695 [candidate division Zixibacteria bacterium]